MVNRINRIRIFFILVGFAVVTGACGPTFAEATITGKVSFEGEVPAAKPINFGAEKQCAAAHGDKMPVVEDLVVNPNNTVKWALVYVKEGADGQYTAPAEPATIDQKGCLFAPHAMAVMAGQKVIFRNDDAVLHNVRSLSKVNKAFNIAQPIQGMTTTKTFPEPEIGVKLRCDVHFWMASYIHVLKNPFFAITGDDGSFTIKGLPAGTYTLEVWHETLGIQTQAVTVGDGESKTIDFSLKKASS